MIKKLRTKFILLSMTAFFAVLTIIIGGINIVNYRNVVEEADELLTILSENNGTFPDTAKPPSTQTDKQRKMPKHLSPEIPYESRYFTVTLDIDSGSVIDTNTSRIASVDSDTAKEYAEKIRILTDDRGFIQDFRYVKYEKDHRLQIIFLDCGRKIDSFQSFLLASIAISLAGFLIVFILIAFFSNRIMRPISESYEKQKRFITDAGHEIKTPLTIINADADVLSMEIGENEWLEDIQKQARCLTDLTNDLVYLARMEESDNTLQMIEFPVSDIIQETADSFQALAQTQNKQFFCQITPLLSCKGNEKAIRQLTGILLDNALKYSPSGGHVSITLEKHGKSLRLMVFNTTSYTITKEHLSLLFDRFYRTDSSRNSQTGGHGIGLSVAKAIVSSHNGKIQASSEDGHSLKISVSLPII